MPETRLAVYVTAQTVKQLAEASLPAEKALELLRRLNVERVYVENYRMGLFVPPDQLAKVGKVFSSEGYEVAGGSCIGTWGEGWGRYADFGFRVICLTDERNLALLEKAMREAGAAFDSILIDDFWAQWCTCPNCVAEFNRRFGLSVSRSVLLRELSRGDTPTARLWSRFSTELLLEVSKERVVKPFREAGGRRVVVKVAEWREDFYVRGLHVPSLVKVFDGIYVGTESRERVRSYGSHYITLLVRELAGGVEGVWFDTYDGLGWEHPVSVETYIDQLLSSLTPLPPELTLFNLWDLLQPKCQPHVEAVEQHYPALSSALSRVGGEPLGLVRPALLPPFSPLEDRYIEDYIGSIGVPLKPAWEVPKGSAVLLTAKEVGLIDLEDLLARVKVLFLTSGAIRRLLRGDAGEAGYDVLAGAELLYDHFAASIFEYRGAAAMEGHRRASLLPVGPVLNARQGESIVTVSDGWERRAAILRLAARGVPVIALCFTDYPQLLGEYPEIVRQAVRDLVGEHLGIKLSPARGPLTNVSLHAYSDGHLVLVNHNGHWVSARVDINPELCGFSGSPTLVRGRATVSTVGGGGFEVELPPRSYAILKVC